MEANELFGICRELAGMEPTAVALRRMHELIVLCCSEGGRQQGGTFGNLFSQVDWLCHHLGITNHDRIAIQTARRHSNGRETITAEEWQADLRAVSRFIAAVCDCSWMVDGGWWKEDRLRGYGGTEVRGYEDSSRYEVRGTRNEEGGGTTGSFGGKHPRGPSGRAVLGNESKEERISYIRCIVRSFDATTITADTEDGEIIIDYDDTEQWRDFGYLQKMLREGMQLNLLDCKFISRYEDSSRGYEGTGVRGCEDSIREEANNYSRTSYLVPRTSKIVPSIIVVEPDYLIDVSALAACFTPYGHHPLLYTLNRLKPRANTQAILLGNFAGTALDDAIRTMAPIDPINHKGSIDSISPQDILKSALQRSFKKEALRYYACEDFSPDKFRAEAAEQVKNICEAVSTFISENLSPLNALLEPSFVCERLGFQGRVDLMTTDMTLLVEQKAGKNMKIEYQSHDSHGLQREDHYVQLLLYYGILRYNFGKSDQQVDTRLLYSRYPADKGLLSVNYYRTLFREAIKLRNQIVATDFFIAREGFGRILPLLNVDYIYKGIARDGFFHHYVEPELQTLLSPLSPLPQSPSTTHAYFERMMTFVYREQLCQKLGVEEGIGGSMADLWQMPLAEKRETGNIFTDLTVTHRERSIDGGGYDLITLHVPDQGDSFLPNFRRGDMVYLYRYDGKPDVRQSILYKGVLMDVRGERKEERGEEIVIALNDGQQNPDIFVVDSPQTWAVEHGGSDVSTNNQIRGLYQLITATPERRDLLLGQREPRADLSQQLSHAYHPNYDDILLRQKQARDYFLLIGPPGTGKTSMALRFMVEEELGASHLTPLTSHLLLCAYTNRAVDEICSMLTDAGIDYLRIGNAASCDPRFRKHLLEERFELCSLATRGTQEWSKVRSSSARLLPEGRKNGQRSMVNEQRVIVGTTSMLQSRPEIFSLKHFSLAVVDEASQILEPGIIGLLASDRIDRFVLIGDYKQLPAVVQQSKEQARVDEQCLRDICLTDCRQSLFERLIRWEQKNGRTQFIGTLQKQGRMHPDVARYPSEQFYQKEQLDVVPCEHQRETVLDYSLPSQDALDDVLKRERMLFIPVRGTATGGSDKANMAEAQVVADLLRRIRRFYGQHFDPQKTVGVIVPYRNQIAMIRKAIQGLGLEDMEEVSIDTVERYQGSQRDVIIYSFTVSRRYQLDFLTSNTFEEDSQPIDRKLNVALTRARKQMIMTGNPDVLSANQLFAELIGKYKIK